MKRKNQRAFERKKRITNEISNADTNIRDNVQFYGKVNAILTLIYRDDVFM